MASNLTAAHNESSKLSNRTIIVEDTTLRDGEQAPGVAFNVAQKLEILDALISAGIRWVEVGIPAMGGDELQALEAMLERRYDANLIAWNRGKPEDIAQSLKLGFRHVHVGLPTSEIHLKSSVAKDRGWLLERATAMIKMGKDAGAFVSISAEDVGRTERTFLQEYAGRVAEAGADRIRLSDTIGTLSPAQYAEVVKAVSEVSSIASQCHCHNDFGLAVANTLAGLEAGATYFHACINGMGERAGMPDIASTLMSLSHFHGVDLGVDLTQLKRLSDIVAKHSRHPCMPWHPVVGDNVFAHESGIHSKGMLADTRTFEPFAPELVGGTRRYVIGKHTGGAAIRHVLAEQGCDVDPTIVDKVLLETRSLATRQSRAVRPDELVDIYHRCVATRDQCATVA
jgi:isopropylmalate/homocitrate/citramalate synthase